MSRQMKWFDSEEALDILSKLGCSENLNKTMKEVMTNSETFSDIVDCILSDKYLK